MIVADGEFIIATTPKCGTYSWRSFANIVPGMRQVLPLHTMDVPDELAGLTRYINVRDPYDRLVSIWTYLRISETQYGHRVVKDMSFKQFLYWFAEQKSMADDAEWRMGKSPWTWTKTQSQSMDRLSGGIVPVTPLKLEEIDESVRLLVERHNLVIPDGKLRKGMFHGNRTEQHRKPFAWTIETIALAKNSCGAGEDAKRFGYKTPAVSR